MTTHTGDTVTLRRTFIDRAARVHLEIGTFVHTSGRTGWTLINKMSGKVLGRSRSWKKIKGHADRLMARMQPNVA